MKNEFMVAIHQVCNERQLPLDTVLEAVEVALISAYKRNFNSNHSITAQISQKSGEPQIFVEKAVVDKVEDANNEISLDDALAIDSDARIGGLVSIESTPAHFGRIAAQTAKQVILQRIREAERDALFRTYAEREGEVINGTVHKVESHQVIITLGNVEAVLPRAEQIPTERYVEGQRLRAYVATVTKSSRGPQIVVSRTHRNMLRRLLEVEVPEIFNGTVEIKSIARESGYRSKVAVAALQEGVDPVGSCVGMRGTRIQNIVNELGGEKIDVVQWNPDIGYFIANALSPAKVTNVMLFDEKGKTAVVVVPDKQLSLAIGKEGQNARLAAKLTGWRIDIKSVYEAATEALEKIKKDSEVHARVAHRTEIFNMSAAILAEKEPMSFSDGELKLLSEAIEVVNIAEMAVRRERKAKAPAPTQKRAGGDDFDLMAEAEALLMGQGPVAHGIDLLAGEETPTVEATDFDFENLPSSALDELALDLLSQNMTEDVAPVIPEKPVVKPEPVVVEVVKETPAVVVKPPVVPVVPEKKLAETKVTPVVEVKPKVKPKPGEPDEEDLFDSDKTKGKKKEKDKKRRLVYSEELGEVVAERLRKNSRRDQNWLEYDENE